MPQVHSCSTSPPKRPTWLLALMAVPMGMAAAGLTGLLENLPQALLTVFGWLHEPTRLQRLAAALTSNVVIPALAVFVTLRLTRAGAWLAPNRLAISALFLSNGLLLSLMFHGIYQASQGMPPYLMGTLRDVVHTTLYAAFGVGLGVLAASTLWHRHLKLSPRAMSIGHRFWSEF